MKAEYWLQNFIKSMNALARLVVHVLIICVHHILTHYSVCLQDYVCSSHFDTLQCLFTEFGHNWGSEHDPDTTECSPGSFSGGKHIMYTYSVSGFDANNKVST